MTASLAQPEQKTDERDLRRSLLRGWRRRCPECGNGSIFSGYLKVHDRCEACGEELYHHRADDGPAYLTILVVGHLMAPALHVLYARFQLEPLMLATVLSLLCIGLSLYMLPRVKGAMIGLQWSKRMHGFGRPA